jgi:hypothetical protein
VTDWASGNLIPPTSATYLYGMDASSRPTVKAFADKTSATKEQQASPGNLLNVGRAPIQGTRHALRVLRSRRLSRRRVCREVRRDAWLWLLHALLARRGGATPAGYRSGGEGWFQRRTHPREDACNGQVALLEPASAVAWFGQHKSADGKWVSAGCFKQGFFVSEANLQKWLDARPAMTGRQITIAQALADKMKLTPQQIAKACKLGECN